MLCPVAIIAMSCMAVASPADGPSADQGRSANLKCGSQCLYIALKSLDLGPTDFAALDKQMGPPGPRGYSMDQLDVAARRFRAQTRAVMTTATNLAKRSGRFAAIVSIENNHFVCLYDMGDGHAFLADPPELRKIPLPTLKALWTGATLLLSKEPIAPEESLEATGRPWAMLKNLVLVAGSLAVVILAARVVRRGMRRPLAAAGVLILVQGCGANDDERRHAPPRLIVSPGMIDLGTIVAGSGPSAAASVQLKNTGEGVLQLNGIASTCGCTIAGRVENKIEPGHAVTLPVQVSLGMQAGPRSSRLKVACNDPEQPEREVEIRWRVEYRVTVAPEVLDFGAVKPGTVTKQVVRYKINKPVGSSRPIFKTGSTALGLAVDAQKQDDLAGPVAPLEGGVTVTLDAHNVTESGATSFTVHYADDPVLLVPVRWTIAEKFVVAPSSDFVSGVAPAASLTRTFFIRSTDQEPFVIADIKADRLLESAVFDRGRSSPMQSVTVHHKMPHLSGTHRVGVRVEVESGEKTTLTIPLTVVVQ